MTLPTSRLGFGAAFFAGLAACSSPPPPQAGTDDPNGSNFALYRDVLSRVEANYVEPVGEDKLITNSLKGMLTGLDPHSDFMTEDEYQEMLDDNSGEFAGIGAELTREDGRPKVISPIDDTPAARAGVKPGDVIVKINGKATEGMSLKEVVDQLRGPAGSTVEITILRHDRKPFAVQLDRAIIHVASVKWQLEPGHVGYARITTFAGKTQSELVSAIDTMRSEAGGKLDGFVLDLRNDPGGLLDEAVRVSGDFLNGGTVVSTRGRAEDDNHVYPAPGDGDRLDGAPMVVLVNGASASASEIVAGALQDRHRATLVGTRTFGKGSVQTIIPLDGHGALRLTTARYYTPDGRSIQAQGIEPDLVVDAPKSQVSAEVEILHEADLRGALTNADPPAADNGRAPPAAAEHEPDDDGGAIDPSVIGTAEDVQLARALAEVHALADRPVAASDPPATGDAAAK
jgi:carboxyl-terminal processing protease